jgi:hypothetical protein
MFNDFCDANGFVHITTAIKMGMAVKRLNIPGIAKKHTMNGNFNSYIIADIRAYYKLDCQV